MEDLKKYLFSVPGILGSIIHFSIVAGCVSTYVFWHVKVLGDDMQIGNDTEQVEHKHKR